jgi:hypothetical protein
VSCEDTDPSQSTLFPFASGVVDPVTVVLSTEYPVVTLTTTVATTETTTEADLTWVFST